MPSSRFQWAPAAGVRSPSAPELDRRENTVPIGTTAPAQELLGGSVIRGQVIRDLPGTLLQNSFEPGPLGSIGVNPGQYRVESTRLGSSRQLGGCARAAWSS